MSFNSKNLPTKQYKAGNSQSKEVHWTWLNRQENLLFKAVEIVERDPNSLNSISWNQGDWGFLKVVIGKS